MISATTNNDEQRRSLVTAETAFGQIATFKLNADPHTYEVMYTYASGVVAKLNIAINEIVAANGTVTQKDIQALHHEFFSPVAQAESIDNAGEKVSQEIAKVLEMLAAVVGTTAENSTRLSQTQAALSAGGGDQQSISAALEVLQATAQHMQSTNKSLQKNLDASRDEINRLHDDLQIVRENSLKDQLTQIYNRKFFDESLVKAMAAQAADAKPLALLMIDIDHFKGFNDKYGHTVGDQVLRVVGGVLKANIKGKDMAARYGGEEFGVILPETSLQGAAGVADIIRRSIMAKELLKKSTGENLGRITLSVGVAVMRPDDTPESLINRADQGLYAAKRNGRNRVICETDPEFDAELGRDGGQSMQPEPAASPSM